jgi:hypothetical protein
MFREKLIGSLGFLDGRAVLGGGLGAHTMPWRGLGVARTMGWCGRLLAPLHLNFGLRHASGKIGTLAFVSSNSKIISCVAFLEHKNRRKQGLALWHLLNMLVLENA